MKSGEKRKFQIKSFEFLQIGLYAFLICIIYGSSLLWLVIHDWKSEAYSYGYLIPFVVLYLLWLNWGKFSTFDSRPSWLGLFSLIPGLIFFWIGKLGGEGISLWRYVVNRLGMKSQATATAICWLIKLEPKSSVSILTGAKKPLRTS